MTKSNAGMSGTTLAINLIACLVTGFWVLPFGIYILMMWSQKRKPSIPLAAAHTVLSLVTASGWLFVIIVYYIVKKK